MMTLHEAIVHILLENGNRGMTAKDIAKRNKELGLYKRKKDGEFPESWQINLRVRNYSAVKAKNPKQIIFRTDESSGEKLIYVVDQKADV